MCTVSFHARSDGYLLGMNRDEQRTRVAGLPPELWTLGKRAALCPMEPGGGTWIGLNNARVTFALINWYSVPARAPQPSLSRGGIVLAALTTDSAESATRALEKLPLNRTNPFRLIGIFPESRAVIEWRWNLEQLDHVRHAWQANTWISSGHDELGAQQTRGKVFARSLAAADAGSLPWLRRLHASHTPERGAYSTCMHRASAVTVSYTELDVASTVGNCRYVAGAPCGGAHSPVYESILPL
jgi:hypothetical protein